MGPFLRSRAYQQSLVMLIPWQSQTIGLNVHQYMMLIIIAFIGPILLSMTQSPTLFILQNIQQRLSHSSYCFRQQQTFMQSFLWLKSFWRMINARKHQLGYSKQKNQSPKRAGTDKIASQKRRQSSDSTPKTSSSSYRSFSTAHLNQFDFRCIFSQMEFKYQFLIIIIRHYFQMLDWEFNSEKSLPYLAPTDASSLCAPLQQPLDTEESPPELMLDGSGWSMKESRCLEPAHARKRSIDLPYSILGFIERRISDRRERVNSEELNKPRPSYF